MRTSVVLILALFAPSAVMAELLTWQCYFTDRVDSSGAAEEGMLLTFVVNEQTGDAFMTGNAGSVPVEMMVGDAAFSFVEMADSGIVQSTSIAADGQAVHSRHTLLINEFVAAQHFGQCTFN